MDQILRILHLEDDEADGELVAATLAQEGVVCECVRAESREQFLSAIDGAFDLILSDYAIPGFDGVSAQTIARERRPDLPFVFVSGTMGEEVAIDRMKAGATDYVLKHRLIRLAPAVRRALEESHNRRQRERAEAEVRRLNAELEERVVERTAQLAETNLLLIEYGEDGRPAAVLGYALDIADRKTAEEEVRRANAFLDSIIENLPVMLFVKDARDLRFVRFNRAGEHMLSIGRTTILGKTDKDLFPPHVADAYGATDRATLTGRSIVDIPEDIVPTRDRGPRILHTRKIPICDSRGEPAYLLGISEDITERRTAEEEARLAKLEAERAN